LINKTDLHRTEEVLFIMYVYIFPIHYSLSLFPSFYKLLGYFGTQRFVDGGALDNTSILALLRRNVNKIISCYATECSLLLPLNELKTTGFHQTLSPLFGRCELKGPGCVASCTAGQGRIAGVDEANYNALRQVFPSTCWDELLTALRAKASAGKAVCHRMTMPVLANPHVGVIGGYEVEVLFIMNAAVAEWENALPPDTKSLLKRQRRSDDLVNRVLMATSIKDADLYDFPCTPINRLNYSPLLVNMLSQLATWNILKMKDEIQSLFAQHVKQGTIDKGIAA
jgi:hypothetical protein